MRLSRPVLAGLVLGLLAVASAQPAKPAAKPPAIPANYPYPQCWTTTQSYDIDFVGPLKSQKVGGVQYGYHRFGPLVEKSSKKPPLVFLPGFGTVMYIWPIPLMQRLAYDREVIILDYPGVGASKNVTGKVPSSVEELATSVTQFIRDLRLKSQPDVLGWSLGGMVALAMAANYGDELGDFLVYSASAGGNQSFAPPEGTWINFLKVRADDNPEFVKYYFPNGAKDVGVCSLYASWNSFYRSKYTQVNRLTIKGESALASQAAAMANMFHIQTIFEKLRYVTNRVMLLHGVEDVLMPVRNAPIAARRIVGSWMITVPEAGHGVIFQNVQAAIFVALEFFGQSGGRLAKDQVKWYEYGRNIPEGTPLRSFEDVAKIISSQNSTDAPGSDALPGLARTRGAGTNARGLPSPAAPGGPAVAGGMGSMPSPQPGPTGPTGPAAATGSMGSMPSPQPGQAGNEPGDMLSSPQPIPAEPTGPAPQPIPAEPAAQITPKEPTRPGPVPKPTPAAAVPKAAAGSGADKPSPDPQLTAGAGRRTKSSIQSGGVRLHVTEGPSVPAPRRMAPASADWEPVRYSVQLPLLPLPLKLKLDALFG